MTSSPRQVEGLPQAVNAQPVPQVSLLSENEVQLLSRACSKKIDANDKNLHRLIEVTSLVVAIAVANFITLAAGGLFFGIATGLLVDITLKSFYAIFKNRDLEYATEALNSDSFKRHLIENNLNPSVPTLAAIWRAYNLDNLARIG